MRLVVTGRHGQVARALIALADDEIEVVALGRPALDLSLPDTIARAVRSARPDVVINAAAYTAVDKAEEETAIAMVINGIAPGALATVTAELGVPIIQISTDYVFDGAKPAPYVETDPVSPINAYGRSKLAGEHAVVVNPRHAILRTSWVYDAVGRNFLTTMLRLAKTHEELDIVADQIGAPSHAPDIARAVVAIASNLHACGGESAAHGAFHLTGGGETSWAGFAREIFRLSGARGGPSPTVRNIDTTGYPTPARRPANSRLNCDKLEAVHGVRLPDWRDAVARCINEMMEDGR